MPGFINATQNISMAQITNMTNVTSVPDFFIHVNQTIYNGYLWFILLWILAIILYRAAQQAKDQPLNNGMYAMAITSIASFILRGIIITRTGGVVEGLLVDHQLWVFPCITAVLALIIWSIKE